MLRTIHESLFSLNLGFAVVASFFAADLTSVISIFFRMEIAINRSLRIPQTDYVMGYFAFILPSTALAICIWIFIRRAPVQVTTFILYYFGIITALAAAPVFWMIATYTQSSRYGWTLFRATEFYELLFVVLYLCLYVSQRWLLPVWVTLCIEVLHGIFWIRKFPMSLFFMGYYILAVALMFASAVAWNVWAAQFRRGHIGSLFAKAEQ